MDVFEHIWRGGMPDALRADPEQRQEYFNSYIETYLMRDVAEEGEAITDVVRFRKFLNACAALTAEQVNYRTLAEAARRSLSPRQRKWVRILQGLGIVYLLPPLCQQRAKAPDQDSQVVFLRYRPVRLPVHVAHPGHPDAGEPPAAITLRTMW